MNFPHPFGPYTLLARINVGGMAEIFRARENDSGALVALKKILPHIAEDEDFISMLQDEARIVSRLEHPHIARMLDFGRVEGGFFIAFEYVHGKDLRAVFERSAQQHRPIPLSFLLYVFSRIGEGVSYAHARRDENGVPAGIVHRDITPQNIIVSTTGDVKLIDFGIAKMAGKVTRTAVGTLKGNLGYMSPEQARGGEADAQSDVFAMGVCLWELLTQRRLFDGENELVVLNKLRAPKIEPPSAFRTVPAELDRVVMRALATEPKDRHRSAKELYRELHAIAISQAALASRDELSTYMRELFPEMQETADEGDPTLLDMRRSEVANALGDRLAALRIGRGSSSKDARQERAKMAAGPIDEDADTYDGPTPASTEARQPQRTSAMPGVMRSPVAGGLGTIGKRTLLGIPAPAPPLNSSDLTPVAVPFSATTPLANPIAATYGGVADRSSANPVSERAPASERAPQSQRDWDDEQEASNVLDAEDQDTAELRPSRRALPPPPTPPPPHAMAQRYRTVPTPAQVPASPYAPQRRFGSTPPFAEPMREPSEPPPSSRRSKAPRATPAAAFAPATLTPAEYGPPAQAFQHGQMLPAGSRNDPTALVRPRPVHLGIFVGAGAALLAVLALVCVVLLLPRTGKVVVHVTDARGANVNHVEIFLDGAKHCDTSPCVIDGVTAGAHDVKALGADGSVSERSVVAEARKEITADFALGSHGGTGLKVAGTPAGTKLWLDGREMGALPLEIKDLAPGDHKVRLAASERYEPLERTVTIGKDDTADLGTIALRVARGKVTITLGTPDAKVYLESGNDRRDLPTFPISVDIDTSKTWVLKASRFGFSDYRQPITFADGQAEKTINVQLDPKTPLPQFAAAAPRPTVNGARPQPPPAPVSPREKTEDPLAERATASSGSDGAQGEAVLKINSIPASSVLLDGKPIGSTPQVHVAVSPGSHTVVFVNTEQGLKKSVQVSVAAGDIKPVVVKLREQ